MSGLQALSANRGGVVVEVEGLRGFVPFSQISAVSFLVSSPSSMGFLSDYHDFALTRSWLLALNNPKARWKWWNVVRAIKIDSTGIILRCHFYVKTFGVISLIFKSDWKILYSILNVMLAAP
jgi:hypothetical protein